MEFLDALIYYSFRKNSWRWPCTHRPFSLRRKVSLSFNFFYADVEGRIAFQFCGLYRVPAEGVDVRLPVSGTGEMEWRGMVPVEDLPYRGGPPKG